MERDSSAAINAFIGVMDQEGELVRHGIKRHFEVVRGEYAKEERVLQTMENERESHRSESEKLLPLSRSGSTPRKAVQTKSLSLARTRPHEEIRAGVKSVLMENAQEMLAFDSIASAFTLSTADDAEEKESVCAFVHTGYVSDVLAGLEDASAGSSMEMELDMSERETERRESVMERQSSRLSEGSVSSALSEDSAVSATESENQPPVAVNLLNVPVPALSMSQKVTTRSRSNSKLGTSRSRGGAASSGIQMDL
jgi:hypothetical protein